jgi:hypothetical protein
LLSAALVADATLSLQSETHDTPPPTIAEGDSQTIFGPHHTDPDHAGTQTHFFAETGDEHHFAWQDQDLSTPNVIDIYYDYRDLGGRWGANKITPGQIEMVELAFDQWEIASGGRMNFIRNTNAPDADILNIGTGNLRALGYRSGPGGILGLGGGTFTHNSDHTITSGIAWMDSAEAWDVINGNGDQNGTFDYFTVVAQEIGHTLGLGHSDDLGGTNIMNGFYTGEVAEFSTNDSDHVQAVYGVGGPVDVAPTVDISSPGLDTQFDSGATVNFAGTASDPEDGTLTDGLVWTSSIDGQIGVGGSFSQTLSDGNHTITASVTDSGGHTVNQSISLTMGTPTVATSVSVDSISYATEGGKNGDKHLSVAIALLDDLGNPPSDASVSITLTNVDSGATWAGTAGTSTDGIVTFTLKNAPSGSYNTVIENVTADSLVWDGSTPSNGFAKASAAVGAATWAAASAESSENNSFFYVLETAKPAESDPANDEAASHRVIRLDAALERGNTEVTGFNNVFRDDSDTDVANDNDSEPKLMPPQELDEFFTGLLTHGSGLLL